MNHPGHPYFRFNLSTLATVLQRFMVLSDLCASSGSESEPGSKSESSSSSEGGSETSEARQLKRFLQRQKQTAKARAASIASRLRKRIARNAELNPPEHQAQAFAKDLTAQSEINRPGLHQKMCRFRRLRLLVSYLRGWGQYVNAFFQQREVDHTLLVAMVDDTNVRLSARPDAEITGWKISRVVSVMNCVQHFIVSYRHKIDPAAEDNQMNGEQFSHKAFYVHSPMTVLPKGDTVNIAREFLSKLLFFLGNLSGRFNLVGISQDFAKDVRLQGTVMVYDSLKANVSMFKMVREAVHKHHKSATDNLYPVLGLVCLLHQLSLARKPILFGFANYWSNVVRLAHLFEGQGFRTQFRVALLGVLHDSFSFVAVSELPSDAAQWQQERVGVYRWTSSKNVRIELHKTLDKFDNGNPRVPQVTHYCVGHCCDGDTQDEKKRFALVQICKYYMLLLSFGYPVPLTYRWVHAQRALQYVKEPSLSLSSGARCNAVLFFGWENGIHSWIGYINTVIHSTSSYNHIIDSISIL